MSNHKTTPMKIFQTVRKNLASIHFSADQRWFDTQPLIYISLSILAIGLQCIYLFCVADTREKLMDSIFMTTVGILVFISHLSVVSKMANIFFLMDKIEKVVNKRLKHSSSKTMYENANQLSEKFSKIAYFLIVKVSIPGVVLPKAVLSFFMYFTTDLGEDAFQLSLPTWLPFDWKNPIGYTIAILIQIRIAALPLRYIACNLTLGFSGFVFAMSMAKDIKIILHSIDKRAKAKQSPALVFKQFCRLIRFTALKPLLNCFTDIYQVSLTVLFLGCTGLLSLALLMIQMEMLQTHNENNTVMLLEAVFCAFWATNLVFVVCELGQRFSNAFNALEGELGQTDWYLYPYKLQRMIPTTMIYAQQPIALKCFGSILCERETFKAVINTAYTYFMMLRKFNK